MSILVDKNTKVLVQGITGRDGSFHAGKMLEYGTKVVGGVTPGKGGQKIASLPVFDTMKEAVSLTGADTSVIYVPARSASSAIKEAASNGIKLIVCITEGVPVIEMIENLYYLKERGATLIGPNCPGVITPGECKVGIMPAHIHKKGKLGVISRSGTLTYEIVYNLSMNGLGQSTCAGIGGDAILGTTFIDLLEKFNEDNQTDAVVLIGEIGGEDEERAAEYIQRHMKKGVVAFVSGRSAPPGKRMGHAGAIISGGKGTAQSKIEAFKRANVPVAERPDEVPELVKSLPKKVGGT